MTAKNWPAKTAKTEKASNRGVLARIQCPRCGRENTPVMLNYRTYMHSNADGSGLTCLGSPAELVFSQMLRMHGLDARQDNEQTVFLEGVDYDADPELDSRQAFADAQARQCAEYAAQREAGADHEAAFEAARRAWGGESDGEAGA